MEQSLYNKRHSLSHILAQALQRYVDPTVQLGTGPAIDDGFYYDIKFADGVEFGEENLKDLEKKMKKIVKEGQEFGHIEIDFDGAKNIVDMIGQEFKKSLLEKFHDKGEAKYTFYFNTIPVSAKDNHLKEAKPEYVDLCEKLSSQFLNDDKKFIVFWDLCEGGHVENTKEIADDSFSLSKIAGAYRQGDEKNPMMTRIYGYAFETKDEHKNFLTMLEEAKKRDHRILGQKLKIFTISQLVGSGLPLLQPNGMIIKQELMDYLRELHRPHGYQRVWTPHLAKHALYETSGHLKHYAEDLFQVEGGSSKEKFCVKPMNCPHHMQIFADNQFSYRDMPVKYFEPATVYRDEKTGQLSGLTRVRSLTQDDGHLFCRINQIEKEVGTIVSIIKKFYGTFGMLNDYQVRLSVRDEKKENYMGTEEMRQTSESALEKICKDNNLPYVIGSGEAAFYGPKLDFMFKDALGRERQLATIQLDVNLPEKFDLSFVNEAGEKERPVVIHRAISGSYERFMGVMIEHFAGAFPMWLAPVQIIFIPVTEKFIDGTSEIAQKFFEKNLRVQIDTSSDSLAKKIRNAELMKIPYMVVVGENELNGEILSVRSFKNKEQKEISRSEFLESMLKERDERTL